MKSSQRNGSPEARRLKLRDKVRAYFDRRGKALHSTGNHFVYTRDEWRARGESFGREYPVSVAAEAAINHALNYDPKEYERLVKWADRNDIGWTQGYSWSWHFWWADDPPAPEERA